MKKLVGLIAILLLAGCVPQDPEVKAPTSGPTRFIDNELGIVCYRYSRDSISCVKI